MFLVLPFISFLIVATFNFSAPLMAQNQVEVLGPEELLPRLDATFLGAVSRFEEENGQPKIEVAERVVEKVEQALQELAAQGVELPKYSAREYVRGAIRAFWDSFTVENMAEATVRGSAIGVLAAIARFNPENPEELLLYSNPEMQIPLIAVIPAVNSWLLHIATPQFQDFLTNTAVTKRLGLREEKLPGMVVNAGEEYVRGLSVEFVYLAIVATGISVIAPAFYPTFSSLFLSVLKGAMLGGSTQVLAEISFARQKNLAKQAFPEFAAQVQRHSNRLMLVLSVSVTALTVSAMTGDTFTTNALYFMGTLSIANYLYTFYQQRQAKKAAAEPAPPATAEESATACAWSFTKFWKPTLRPKNP